MDESQIEAVAKAICAACDENPMHTGDCRGNNFRWQDYRAPAIAAIKAMGPSSTLAGYTADDMDGDSRTFTVYRNVSDAEFEAKATGLPVTAVFRD